MTVPLPSTHARLHAVVHGRVQGVGFRAWAVADARQRGLYGHARNLADGRSVEIVAEGERQVLEAYLERLHQGPRSAHVDSVEAIWGPAQGSAQSFEVWW